MQNLEKALRKNKTVMTILIIALILLLLYTIVLAGDVSSAKSKTERVYRVPLTELRDAKEDIQDDTADFEKRIAENQAEIDALNADIEAIKAGTYTAD
ncbi:MAG: hypothetical protein ACOYI5_10810 [Christensenellales bacterium]|jgi:peptidoglycan hydrolase CwlO-like protein